jgi:hypothetical protein
MICGTIEESTNAATLAMIRSLIAGEGGPGPNE